VEKCGAGRAATGENARPASAMQLENENTAANAKQKKNATHAASARDAASLD
jgi:hypothetical protein